MVEGNAVQVAAAIVEITDTLPVGTDGFGTVAQCVVAVMPDMASGGAVQAVVAVFSDKVAEFVVEVLVAAVGVLGSCQSAAWVIGVVFFVGFVYFSVFIGHKDAAAFDTAGGVVIQLGDGTGFVYAFEYAALGVMVTGDFTVKAFFFGQRADAVVAEAVKIAVLVQQPDQTAVKVVSVLDLLSECVGTDEETAAFVVGIAGALLERIGMLKQSAFRIMQVGFPRAVCLDYSLGIAP